MDDCSIDLLKIDNISQDNLNILLEIKFIPGFQNAVY